MSLRRLFDKALAAEGLVVNLVRDFPSLRALWEDGRRLPGDIRLAWAMPDVRPDPDQTLERNIIEGRLTPAELQEVDDAITVVERGGGPAMNLYAILRPVLKALVWVLQKLGILHKDLF